MAIDLYCGLGGWTAGLLTNGYRVIGFDIERHVYGDQKYPAQLVLQDVLTLHGSQFRDAALIVASPPCQEYSYMSMPWTRAKKLAAWYRESPERIQQLSARFDACFRIQMEASEAAGRHIPLIVENVKGAQPWVGRAKWHFGSYYLWGDVPALMPFARGRKVNHHLNGSVPVGTGKTTWFFGNTKHELRDGVKNIDTEGRTWFDVSHGKSYPGQPGNPANGRKSVDPEHGTRGWFGPHDGTNVERVEEGYGIKQGGNWWHDPESLTRRFSSRSSARKAASAQIAKIPFELASHVARVFRPIRQEAAHA